jgi:hypothetical protein
VSRGAFARARDSFGEVTSDAAALLRADAPLDAARRPWADALEFLLVGGGSLLLLPLLYWYRKGAGLEASEPWVGFMAFHAAVLVNNPHFAVSYLLFYREVKARLLGREYAPLQRARYLVAGFLVPFGLALWVSAALVDHSARTLGFLIQLMFFLVGWHYVKQGFGVVTVLSQRRGVRFGPWERRAILGHCFAGWLHGRTNPRDPGKPSVVDDVLYTSLAHPAGLDVVTRVAFLASTALLAWVLLKKWRRDGRPPPLVPLFAFLISVWLWTAFSRIDPLFAYVIPFLHSLQYLYFVWLLRRNAARAQAGPPAFRSVTRSLALWATSAIALGWLLFRGLPSLLDSKVVLWDALDPLGTTPYLAALSAFINIHHYAMDAVIWRRELPETKFLLV